MTDPAEQTPEPEQGQPERPPWWGSPWTGIAVLAGLACVCNLAWGSGPEEQPHASSLWILLVVLACLGTTFWGVFAAQYRIDRRTAHRREAKARRRWQFSLQSLLMVLTLGAVLCSLVKTLPMDVVDLVPCLGVVVVAALLLSVAISILIGLGILVAAVTTFLERTLDRVVSSFNQDGPSVDEDEDGVARQ